MLSWFQFFLFLHILGAVIAFGPTFVFPLIGPMGGAEPAHGNFALRVTEKIEDRLVIPVALTMPVTGALMIIVGGISLMHFWLLAGIALYVVAMVIAIGLQRPLVMRMIHFTSQPPPALAAAGPGAAPAGPPPEFLAMVKRSQQGGIALSVLFLLIMALMILRPGS